MWRSVNQSQQEVGLGLGGRIANPAVGEMGSGGVGRKKLVK
jgi:hypothetical protein